MIKSLVFFCIFLFAINGSLVTAGQNDDGFLEGSSCHSAKDCYIGNGNALALACYYNVNKCKCYNTVSSIYQLTWDKESRQCLSSKYGHCGENGAVKVGCADGFVCANNRCVDPKDDAKAVKDAFTFPVSDCISCRFSEELSLMCEGWDTPSPFCTCRQNFPADKRGNVWELGNYVGSHNCSVSQFGPCGTKDGVKIECHGEGMECVKGICTNPAKPLSSLNEKCQESKNCGDGNICSHGYVCIKPNSAPREASCNSNEECSAGLVCKSNPQHGPWSSRRCYGPNEFNRKIPQ